MYTPVENVIAFAKTIIKTADDIDVNLFKEWIYYGALLELGISDDEIEVAEIIPRDLLAPLPPDCRYIFELSLLDSKGGQLPHKFRTGVRRIYQDKRSVGLSGKTVVNTLPVDVSNDRFNIVLGTNGNDVASILLRYFKYPIDEHGQMLIREEDTMACAYFIKYMMALRDDDNQSKIINYKQTWWIHADKAKAAKRTMSMPVEKAKQVLSDITRSIPQFNQNLF